MSTLQYTVRNVPSPVDQALRSRARRQAKSFNQTLIEALGQATGTSEKPTQHHDLDWFIGSKSIDKKAFSRTQNWLSKLPNDLR